MPSPLSWRALAVTLLAAAFSHPQATTAADSTALAEEARPAGQPPYIVSVRGGSVLVSRSLLLQEEILEIETESAGPVRVEWWKVTSIFSRVPVRIVLEDGRRLEGIVRPRRSRTAFVDVDGEEEPVVIRLVEVAKINAPEDPPLHLRAKVAAGASMSDGNSQARNASLLGELLLRRERHRLRAEGLFSYADDGSVETQRNAKGLLKYDVFATHRLYGYAAARVEHDPFRDLRLRGLLSLGPGYQFVERGDKNAEWLNGVRWMQDLDFSGEIGVAYVTEDRSVGPDRDDLSMRWSARIDWPVMPRLDIFHVHEGYPRLTTIDDVYITSRQGAIFELLWGFGAIFQVNWDWDNKPPEGVDRSDFLYIVGIEYRIDL